ncbi:CPBP family intramembrane glutamic endopeptidase [Clostridium polynesiense]|uniref:CPBP family intramembrane glutamic endopeptidase n=1 Tax=Clostridium polynesiense TaxID=1325933 RepID=UPI00058FEA38|nr:type II CAAX endopeptidase family protein [Clostridium polynesiense]
MLSKNKGLFKEASSSKYLPNIFFAVLLTFGFLLGGQTLGLFIIYFFISSISSVAIESLMLLIFQFLFISLFVFLWVKKVEKRSISSLGLKGRDFFAKFSTGFIFGCLLFSLVVGLLYLLGNAVIETKSLYPTGLSALTGILIILPGWIVQGSTEEILTRGWFMNVLGARYNAYLALIVSSSLFGFLHLANNGVTILSVINIILVGLLLGLYMIKTDDLWGACGFHAAWNWVQGNIYGLEVSGNQSGAGSLINLKLVGSEIFTGGNFGPEGSIACTLALSLGIIVMVILILRDKRSY